MRTFASIDELQAQVGSHLGHSGWQLITQQQVDDFARVTGDNQWIHVDVDRAKEGPFGSTVAHGFLTLSLLPALVADVYTITGVKMAINYGSDRLRFPAPVPVGSKVRAGVDLIRVSPAQMGYQVATRVTIERSDHDKPACVVDMLALVVP